VSSLTVHFITRTEPRESKIVCPRVKEENDSELFADLSLLSLLFGQLLALSYR
jgi:hypothetical protein